MYEFNTKRSFQSEACPGVSFTLKVPTEGDRLQIREMNSAANRKMNEILRDMAAVEQDESMDDREKTAANAEHGIQFDDLMASVINPNLVGWGLQSIEGLRIDGVEAIPDDRMRFPPQLFDEIVGKLRGFLELGAEESKNSESPTISGEQEGGTTQSTAAQSASAEATT